MKKYIIGLVMIIVFVTVYTEEIKGEGHGKNEEKAKEAAVQNLNKTIYDKLGQELFTELSVSKFYGKWKNRKDEFEDIRKKIKTGKIELPIVGVNVSFIKSRGEVLGIASFNYENVKIYEDELESIKKKIDSSLKELEKKESNSEKTAILFDIIKQMDNFNKYEIMAEFLRSAVVPDITVTKSDLREQIKFYEDTYDNLNVGLKKVLNEIKLDKVFIYEPTKEGSQNVSDLSIKVREFFIQNLNAVSSPINASFFLIAEYKTMPYGVEFTFKLTDRDKKNLKTVKASFLSSAYKGLDPENGSKSLDDFVYGEMLKIGDVSAELSVNVDKKLYAFKKGEIVKLAAKVDRVGYLILVAHSSDAKYSYLVNFSDKKGDEKFIYQVNNNEVNKYIDLGNFEVISGFGSEKVELIMFTVDPLDVIPQNKYDEDTGLYKIGDDPFKVIEKLRRTSKEFALARKANISESVIEIITSKK